MLKAKNSNMLKFSDRFAALGNLDYDVDINKA